MTVTPYMLPRDYNGSSAAVVPHELAAPLDVGAALGRPGTPTTTSGKKIPPDLRSSQYESGATHQWLMASSGGGTPSEISSGSGSGGLSTLAFAYDQDAAHAGREFNRPMTPTRVPSAMPQPVVHAVDSGHRLLPPVVDPDEVLSQDTTLPPAYNADLYN